MKQFYILLIGLFMLFIQVLKAQDSLPISLQEKYAKQVSQKTDRVEQLIQKRSTQQLDWLVKEEKKIYQKMAKIDPQNATHLLDGPMQKIQGLKARLMQKSNSVTHGLAGEYNSQLDTMQAAVKFLNVPSAEAAKNSINALKGKFEQSDEIEKYISSRRGELQQELAQYGSTFTKNLKDLNKQAYYYSTQMQEYKSLLGDRDKAQAKALQILRKSSVFQNFMAKNSMIASMFNMDLSENIEEFQKNAQTRAMVESMVQGKAGTDPGARALLKVAMSKMFTAFTKSKGTVPLGFTPNEMKTQRFLKRLQIGGNISFDKPSLTNTTTANLAAQIGYKLHQNGSVGIGGAYKLGMGSLQKIQFSHQGFSARSFVDWRLKGILFVNGGLELNHYSFKGIEGLKKWNGYQKVALMGLSIKMKVKSVTTSTLFAYNFLAVNRAPLSSPFIYRIAFTN